jgi:hypothetical protein
MAEILEGVKVQGSVYSLPAKAIRKRPRMVFESDLHLTFPETKEIKPSPLNISGKVKIDRNGDSFVIHRAKSFLIVIYLGDMLAQIPTVFNKNGNLYNFDSARISVGFKRPNTEPKTRFKLVCIDAALNE